LHDKLTEQIRGKGQETTSKRRVR